MPDFDASAPEQDFLFDQGDDESFAVTRNKSDGTTYDISNWTFWLTIKSSKAKADANADVQKTVSSHTDPTNGQTHLNLTNSDTDGLSGLYYYDIQENTSAGNINTILTGTMYFEDDVTGGT